MGNTINDEKMEGKIADTDKTTITAIVDDTIKWLGTNQTASKDAFEAKRKEVEGTVGPLMQKIAQGTNDGCGSNESKTGGCGAGATPGGFGCAKPANAADVDIHDEPDIES